TRSGSAAQGVCDGGARPVGEAEPRATGHLPARRRDRVPVDRGVLGRAGAAAQGARGQGRGGGGGPAGAPGTLTARALFGVLPSPACPRPERGRVLSPGFTGV